MTEFGKNVLEAEAALCIQRSAVQRQGHLKMEEFGRVKRKNIQRAVQQQ